MFYTCSACVYFNFKLHNVTSTNPLITVADCYQFVTLFIIPVGWLLPLWHYHPCGLAATTLWHHHSYGTGCYHFVTYFSSLSASCYPFVTSISIPLYKTLKDSTHNWLIMMIDWDVTETKCVPSSPTEEIMDYLLSGMQDAHQAAGFRAWRRHRILHRWWRDFTGGKNGFLSPSCTHAFKTLIYNETRRTLSASCGWSYSIQARLSQGAYNSKMLYSYI